MLDLRKLDHFFVQFSAKGRIFFMAMQIRVKDRAWFQLRLRSQFVFASVLFPGLQSLDPRETEISGQAEIFTKPGPSPFPRCWGHRTSEKGLNSLCQTLLTFSDGRCPF